MLILCMNVSAAPRAQTFACRQIMNGWNSLLCLLTHILASGITDCSVLNLSFLSDLKCRAEVGVEQMLSVQAERYDARSAVWSVLLKAAPGICLRLQVIPASTTSDVFCLSMAESGRSAGWKQKAMLQSVSRIFRRGKSGCSWLLVPLFVHLHS